MSSNSDSSARNQREPRDDDQAREGRESRVLHGASRIAWGFRCSRLFTQVPSRRR